MVAHVTAKTRRQHPVRTPTLQSFTVVTVFGAHVHMFDALTSAWCELAVIAAVARAGQPAFPISVRAFLSGMNIWITGSDF